MQNFIQSGVPLFLGGGGACTCTMYNVHAVVADEYHSEETTTTQSSLEYHITYMYMYVLMRDEKKQAWKLRKVWE